MQDWHRLWVDPPSDGAGVAVGVIDGGVVTHPAIPAIAPSDLRYFAGGEGDRTGHGTAAVGLVASLVPAARIIVAQAIRDDFTASDADLAEALEWVLDRGARVVLLGIGRVRAWGAAPDRRWTERARKAWAQGALLFAPCGNGSRPGSPEAVRDPAACPGVVAVGALDRFGRSMSANAVNDGVADVDLFAPGLGLSAPAPGDRVAEVSGSSAAAAVAAGWAASVAGTRERADATWVRSEILALASLRHRRGLLDPQGSTT